MKLCCCALRQEPCIEKTEATTWIVPSGLQEGKQMTAQEEGRIEGIFPHEEGNPYSSKDVLLKIPIVH